MWKAQACSCILEDLMCLQVKGSRVYTEHVAQYTEPLALRVKSTSYYKAAVEHVRPAHMAGGPIH